MEDMAKGTIERGLIPSTVAEGLYMLKDVKEFDLPAHCTPIYNQVIQMEAVEMHILSTIVKDNDGIVCQYNTDSVGACWDVKEGSEKEVIDITQYFWDDDKKVRKYKFETNKYLKVEAKQGYIRSNNYRAEGMMDVDVDNECDRKWNKIEAIK